MYKLPNLDIIISEEQLDHLLAQREASKGGVPKEKQDYWFTTDWNNKSNTTWCSSAADFHRLSTGNLFLTEADYDKYIEYQEALKKINQYKREKGMNWRPDWGNHDKLKWNVSFNYRTDDCVADYNFTVNSFHLLGYFQTQEQANQFISDMEAEIRVVANY